MSSIDFHTSKNRWRVRWHQADGARRYRYFRLEQDARDFAAALGDYTPAPLAPNSSGPIAQPLIERLAQRHHVDEAGCWIWTGPLNNSGYGVLSINDKTTTAHRASYELYVGPVEIGHQVDHLCRVRACINPDHLESVTPAENQLRRYSAVSA